MISIERRGAAASAVLAVALSGMATAGAVAQVVPPTIAGQVDPGAIARQTRQTQGAAAAQPQVPGSETLGLAPTPAPPPIVFPPGGATLVLKSVEFTPSSLLPQSDLDAIAAAVVGHPVDLAALQSVANQVNVIYAVRGYVTASAILPPQDLATGVLKVQLIEGKVGAVSLANRQTLREGYLTTAVPLEGGTVVDAPALRSDVDRFNRTSTAQLQASLQPGAAFGLTDINLAISEPRRNTLQVFGDNLGVESVGEYEAGGLFQHYGLLGLDDRLTVYGLYSEGNLLGNAAYNLAISPYGTRAGLSYSRSAIRIVNGPFSDLDIDGTSETGALNVSHPVYNNGPFLLLGNLSGSLSKSSTDQSTVTVTEDETRRATVGLSGSYFGQIFSLTLSPTISFAEADLTIVDETLNYTVYQMSGQTSLRLDDKTLLTTRGTMQVASDDLLPGSDLFQIGGPATVRGYPTSAASGDAGYTVNVELYHAFDTLLPGLEGFAFVDNGSVFSEFPSRVTLTSAGLGVNYNWNDRLRAELSFGIPLKRDVVPDQGDGVIYARLVATVF